MSSSLFKTFRDNIAVGNAGDISKSYGSITTRLNKDFWDMESDTAHRRQVGSYGRSTAIHGISDLDMIFELPWSLYEKYKAYTSNGPSQLLQAVKDSIIQRYPNTEIKGDGQVVCIEFNKYRVEVLPAFWDNDKGGYLFADSNDGGDWRYCYPIKEIEAFDKLNKETNRNLKHVCKMVRAWKNTHGVSMSGMLIDTLVYKFFCQTDEFNTVSYGSYGELFLSFFSYIANLEYQEYWIAPGSGQWVHNSGKFQSKAKKAAAKCKEAVDTDSDYKQAKLWREVFGRCFPIPTIKFESASFRESASTTFTGEKFIEDMFAIDITQHLEINSEISNNGAREGFLTQLSQVFTWLPHGRKLRFYVEACSAPRPFQLFWKVRNVGDEAERRRCLRGEITQDLGNFEKKESTDFRGEHYVEAYIVKDGVCIARDRIEVPIE